MSAALQLPEVRTRRRLQLLTHSSVLRTALRRALASSPYRLTPETDGASAPGQSFGETQPDCVVLDASLPGLRGLALLRQIKTGRGEVPVIVVAPDTAHGREMRAEALRNGALGCLLKPETDQPLALRPVAEAILSILESAPTTARIGTAAPAASAASALGSQHAPVRPRAGPRQPHRKTAPQVLVVGSSTGGPQALISLFSQLEPSSVRVPVLIVQHMPAAFTPILAEHLTRATRWRAGEAGQDEPLTPGEIRIAPGGHHLIIDGTGARKRLRLTDTPPVNFCRPSADVLFVSSAEAFGRGVLAVVLTGMGNDGAQGAKVISAAGGAIYAQDRETSVVWGMPGAAVGTGVVDRVLPLDAIAPAIKAAMMGVS